ncbi:MAG: hypothetical protein JST00_46895 [Deltaproteobacteria bacterium]|nr:hypothetical protein [Deltaproteobacteria bacterium]
MKRLRIVALSLLSMCGFACDSAEKREAEQVVFAVERFRRADNPSKPAAVETLRAIKCTAEDVCRARDACLASAEATARALKLKSEVEQGLTAIERDAMPKDSEDARLLPFKLDEAENLLKEGFDRLGPCDDQLMALKRKHKI